MYLINQCYKTNKVCMLNLVALNTKYISPSYITMHAYFKTQPVVR